MVPEAESPSVMKMDELFMHQKAESCADAIPDEVIRKYVPSGDNIRDKKHKLSKQAKLKDLKCLNHINYDRAINSLGTLGGGKLFS